MISGWPISWAVNYGFCDAIQRYYYLACYYTLSPLLFCLSWLLDEPSKGKWMNLSDEVHSHGHRNNHHQSNKLLELCVKVTLQYVRETHLFTWTNWKSDHKFNSEEKCDLQLVPVFGILIRQWRETYLRKEILVLVNNWESSCVVVGQRENAEYSSKTREEKKCPISPNHVTTIPCTWPMFS